MVTSVRTVLAVGAILTLPLAVAACGGDGGSDDVPSNAIASVDGRPVTKADYEHLYDVTARSAALSGGPAVVPDPPSYANCTAALARAATAARGRSRPTEGQLRAQCRQLDDAVRDRSIAQLIQSIWLEEEAERLGVEVTDAAIARARREAFPSTADYRRLLRVTGMTPEDVDFQLRFQQLGTRIPEKIQRDAADVTDAQVADYYERNEDQFAVPERRDLELIQTRSEARARAAKAALDGGASWASAARRFSTDAVSKANGGRLAGVAKGQQDRALDEAAFGARAGVVVGPVRGQFGWYLVRVTDVTPARPGTLAGARGQIRELLAQQNGSRAVERYAREFQERWTELTTCRAGFVIAICDNAPRPRTTSTAGGAPATTP